MLRKIIGSATFLFGFLRLSITGFSVLQAVFEPEKFTPADVIVVLGAGMDADDTLHSSTILRVKKGVALFQAGAAPRMHFTGGMGVEGGPPAGHMMARLAHRMAVPIDATRLILVTEGFHLPRSWASFHWAAWQHNQVIDVALAQSTAFRQQSQNARFSPVPMVVREAMAWGFNLSRIIGWHGAGWIGASEKARNAWLQ